MLLEQQVAEGGELAFTNEDGTPATWLEVVPERTRRRTFAWRASLGLVLAFTLWGIQYNNGVLDFAHGWFGILPICFGLALGSLVYRDSDTVRRYTAAPVRYSARERFYRALWWWVLGVVIATLIWWVQPEQARFSDYWWYAWPSLPFVVVGLGLYMRKGGEVLSPAAKKAKTYFNMLDAQASESESSFGEFLNLPLVRYPIAALLLYGTYYFGVESTDKNAGWEAAACLLIAGVCARELSKWILGIAFFGAVAWAVISGISALPVSAAIIFGALIIASAMKK